MNQNYIVSNLLILDEATTGLDPVVRDEILDIFLEFIQDEEHSILLLRLKSESGVYAIVHK